MLHDLNSKESMCNNDLQVKKTGSCRGVWGEVSQKTVLTPGYTQCTTLAVLHLASCPTELKGSFMPTTLNEAAKHYFKD